MHLVFNTHGEAYVANAIITLNMRLAGNVTVQWSEVRERLDGKFVIPKPEESVMQYVTGFTEEEYSAEWFESEE